MFEQQPLLNNEDGSCSILAPAGAIAASRKSCRRRLIKAAGTPPKPGVRIYPHVHHRT